MSVLVGSMRASLYMFVLITFIAANLNDIDDTPT